MTERWQQEDIDRLLTENPDISVHGDRKENPLPRLARAIKHKENKYHAVRTWSELCQRTFDSKAESRRGEELYLLEKAGVISDLRYQVTFQLSDKPKISAKIDFAYLENGKRVLEDVKGILTRDSRTRYAWIKKRYKLEVRLKQA